MKLKINIKYILTVSLAINCLIAGRYLSNKLPPEYSQVKLYKELTPDLYYKTRVDTFSILNSYSYNKKEKIMFIGDSIIDGCEWHELLSEEKFEILNRGINSDRIEGVINRLPTLINESPKIIFIMIGINNLQHGATDEYILDKYAYLLNDLKLHLPDTEIFVMSILPVSKNIAEKTQIKSNDRIKNLNYKIEELAIKYNIRYINFFDSFLENNYINSLYTFDGLHPNGEGYEQIKLILNKYSR